MADKSHPLVSIVILNWNGLENTKLCLESVYALDYPNFEVVLVDNGSSDGSKNYFANLEGIVFVDNPVNRGFTGGHIDGLAASSGDFVVLLNNDAVVKPNLIKVALKHFSDKQVAAVGGRMYHWDDKLEPYDESNTFYSYQEISPITAEAKTLDYDHGVVQEVNNVSGACVMVRRSFIDEVGYFYDKFFAYYEETDLFARAKRAGYKVLYDPAFQVWHLNGASTTNRKAMFYYLIFRNRFLFAVRQFEPQFLGQFLAWHFRRSLKAMARYLLKREAIDLGMSKAFFGSLWHLPAVLLSRRRLAAELPDTYNRHLVRESASWVSIIIDCRELHEGLGETLLSIHGQSVNHIDIVIVLSEKTKHLTGEHSGHMVRYLLDNGRNHILFENLGTIATKGKYVMALRPGDIISPGFAEELTYHMIAKKAVVVGFGQSTILPGYLIDKEALITVGGYDNSLDTATAQDRLLRTMRAWGREVLHLRTLDGAKISDYPQRPEELTGEETTRIKHVGRALRYRHTRLGQLLQKALGAALRLRLIFWPYILTRWLFEPSLRLRAKLGRLKALLVAVVAGDKNEIRAQLKHSRNEIVRLDGDARRRELPVARFAGYKTPIFIICRDRLTPLLQLIGWLEKNGYTNIILVDNQSTYLPLLDYFVSTPYQVLRLDRNVGHRSPWVSGAVQLIAQDTYYVVTDPDVIPDDGCPSNALAYFRKLLNAYSAFDKVGFGLLINDLPAHYSLRDHVIEWEKQFWKLEVEPNVYDAGVDTTFALYRPRTEYFIHPSLRTGKPYVARHLPWYTDSTKLSVEDRYYRNHANQTVNSWDTDNLPERYAKEMAQQRKLAAKHLS